MTAVLELPETLRWELKDPLGPIRTDAAAVLAEAAGPVVTVGDVVTYHILQAGHTPRLALVDERTKRSPVDDEIWDAIDGFDEVSRVENPAATLTDDLLRTIRDGLASEAATLVVVDGEEDLAALPVVAIAPDGATVLYGQPDEGMVVVTVGDAERERVLGLLDGMDGDHDAARRALGLAD
ncbi:GTP-dependent dephospho-CoA kinase family protein [Haloarculaceae archaeon H-GB11]|nr:GTP-dependent dephospho-CoA kinase family protein [Haloarculaceae archaeon H-GB11]